MSWLALLIVFGLTMGMFLMVVLGMAIGVLFGRKQLSGSCGGVANDWSMDGSANCSLCSTPDKACREFARRMKTGGLNSPETDTRP